MVAIYALGHVSGANFNPAVSVTLGLANKLPWPDVAVYSVVQIIAGICAGLSYHAAFAYPGQKAFTLGPAATFGWQEVMLVEMLYTCMLCFVVLNVATASKNQPNEYYGLAIGFVIVAGGYAAGGVSGGAFNPAVAFGIDVAGSATQFGWCFYYLIYEVIGAGLASGLFRLVRPDEFGSDLDEYTTTQKLTSEFLGTFYLCLTVGLCVLGKSPVTPWSAAAALMCMIYALGSVSGANFNPAVTLALLITGKGGMTMSLAPMYMVMQVLGGFAAGATSIAITGTQLTLLPPNFGYTPALIGETFYTFVLCFVVLNVACTTMPEKLMGGGPAAQIYGLAIGFCIMVGAGATGNVSGAALNPAVALPIDEMGKGGMKMHSLGYTGVEFVGAALAAGAMMAVRPAEFGKEGKKPLL